MEYGTNQRLQPEGWRVWGVAGSCWQWHAGSLQNELQAHIRSDTNQTPTTLNGRI